MRVTFELTDEQADAWVENYGHLTHAPPHRPAWELALILCRAIVAARPKPLEVGDTVKGDSGQDRTVLGFGVDSKGRRWLVIDGPYGYMTAWVPTHTMADGSPIVWPES